MRFTTFTAVGLFNAPNSAVGSILSLSGQITNTTGIERYSGAFQVINRSNTQGNISAALDVVVDVNGDGNLLHFFTKPFVYVDMQGGARIDAIASGFVKKVASATNTEFSGVSFVVNSIADGSVLNSSPNGGQDFIKVPVSANVQIVDAR